MNSVPLIRGLLPTLHLLPQVLILPQFLCSLLSKYLASWNSSWSLRLVEPRLYFIFVTAGLVSLPRPSRKSLRLLPLEGSAELVKVCIWICFNLFPNQGNAAKASKCHLRFEWPHAAMLCRSWTLSICHMVTQSSIHAELPLKHLAVMQLLGEQSQNCICVTGL